MGKPAAKKGDSVTAIDIHIVNTPTSPALLPHDFNGIINDGLSKDVNIMGKPAAIVGSKVKNNMNHLPTPPGISFSKEPSNKGTIKTGSSSVFINGEPAARSGDMVETCNDPVDMPVGTINAVSSVNIGG